MIVISVSNLLIVSFSYPFLSKFKPNLNRKSHFSQQRKKMCFTILFHVISIVLGKEISQYVYILG